MVSLKEETPGFFTGSQAARLLNVHIDSLLRWEKDGQLVAVNGRRGQKLFAKNEIFGLRESVMYSSRLGKLDSKELLTQIARLFRTVASNSDPQVMAQKVVKEAVQLIGSNRCSIYLLDHDKSFLIPYVTSDLISHSIEKEKLFKNPIPLSAQPFFLKLLDANEVGYVYDTFNNKDTTSKFFERFLTRALIAAPLRTLSGEIIGFLSFTWVGQPRLFIEEELVFAETLAEQTAVGLENIRLYQIQKDQVAEMNTLFETIADGIIVCDSEAQLVRWNSAAKRIFVHFDLENHFTMSQRINFHKIRRLDGQAITTEEGPAYRVGVKGEMGVNITLVIDGESGPDTVISCSGLPLLDQKGVTKGGVIVVRNITEEYNTRLQMIEISKISHKNAAQLAAVIDAAAEGMVVYDNESRILLANQKLAELYGLSKDQIIGLTSQQFIDVIRPLFSPVTDLEGLVARVKSHGVDPYSDELDIIAPQPRLIKRLVTPVLDEQGQVIGKVAVYRDLTEERALARAKDEFISVAAHELKTPLAAVMGYAQVLLKRIERVEQKEQTPNSQASLTNMARRISEQAIRLNELINDLLDISRISTGNMPMQKQKIELSNILNNTVEQVQISTTRHHIKVEESEIPDLALFVDKNRIEQVLRNLLENAVKYSPESGDIIVSVNPHYQDMENTYFAKISIKDHGIGVSPEQRLHLFEKFYRASNASGMAVGLGLGLSICAEIVKQHGGQIWVESEGENMGSTFVLTLPLAEPPQSII